MSAADMMRQFCPDLTDWQIEVLLSGARVRRDLEREHFRPRQWWRRAARTVKRRRSSYGSYLADGLYREGCGGKTDWCEDCTEIVLDASMREGEPFYDTYRRVVMRYEMHRPLLDRSAARMRTAYRKKAR